MSNIISIAVGVLVAVVSFRLFFDSFADFAGSFEDFLRMLGYYGTIVQALDRSERSSGCLKIMIYLVLCVGSGVMTRLSLSG